MESSQQELSLTEAKNMEEARRNLLQYESKEPPWMIPKNAPSTPFIPSTQQAWLLEHVASVLKTNTQTICTLLQWIGSKVLLEFIQKVLQSEDNPAVSQQEIQEAQKKAAPDLVGIEILANLPKQQWDYILDGINKSTKDNLLQQFAARIFTHLLGYPIPYETFCGQCGFWIAVECEEVPTYLPKNFAIHKNRFLKAFKIVYDWMEENLSNIWHTCCDPIVYVRSKYHPSSPSKRILWIGTRYDLLTSGNVAALTSACPPPCQHGKAIECECLPSLWDGSFVWSSSPRISLSDVAFSGPKLSDNQLFKMCALNVETEKEYQTQLTSLLTDENADYVLTYSDYLRGPPKKSCLLYGPNMSKTERRIFPAIGMFRFVVVIESDKQEENNDNTENEQADEKKEENNDNENKTKVVPNESLQKRALACARQFLSEEQEKPNLIILLVSQKDKLGEFLIITNGCPELTPKVANRPLKSNCYWIRINEFKELPETITFNYIIIINVSKALGANVSKTIIKDVYEGNNFESVIAYGSKPEINPHLLQLFPVEYWLSKFEEPMLPNRIRFFQQQCLIVQKPKEDNWTLRLKSEVKTKSKSRAKPKTVGIKDQTTGMPPIGVNPAPGCPAEAKPRTYSRGPRKSSVKAIEIPQEPHNEEETKAESIGKSAPGGAKTTPVGASARTPAQKRSRATKVIAGTSLSEEDEPIFKNVKKRATSPIRATLPVGARTPFTSPLASPLTLLWDGHQNSKIHLLVTSTELTSLIQAYLPKPRFRELLRSLHAGGRFISYDKLRAFAEVTPSIKTSPGSVRECTAARPSEICLICVQLQDVQRALISPCQHQFCLSCLSRWTKLFPGMLCPQCQCHIATVSCVQGTSVPSNQHAPVGASTSVSTSSLLLLQKTGDGCEFTSKFDFLNSLSCSKFIVVTHDFQVRRDYARYLKQDLRKTTDPNEFLSWDNGILLCFYDQVPRDLEECKSSIRIFVNDWPQSASDIFRFLSFLWLCSFFLVLYFLQGYR
jgi:hypothetical protein